MLSKPVPSVKKHQDPLLTKISMFLKELADEGVACTLFIDHQSDDQVLGTEHEAPDTSYLMTKGCYSNSIHSSGAAYVITSAGIHNPNVRTLVKLSEVLTIQQELEQLLEPT